MCPLQSKPISPHKCQKHKSHLSFLHCCTHILGLHFQMLPSPISPPFLSSSENQSQLYIICFPDLSSIDFFPLANLGLPCQEKKMQPIKKSYCSVNFVLLYTTLLSVSSFFYLTFMGYLLKRCLNLLRNGLFIKIYWGMIIMMWERIFLFQFFSRFFF